MKNSVHSKFTFFLVSLDADFITAFLAAGAQNPAASHFFHPAPETMDLLAFTAIGLVGSFHGIGSLRAGDKKI
jgi:hypothetical protein